MSNRPFTEKEKQFLQRTAGYAAQRPELIGGLLAAWGMAFFTVLAGVFVILLPLSCFAHINFSVPPAQRYVGLVAVGLFVLYTAAAVWNYLWRSRHNRGQGLAAEIEADMEGGVAKIEEYRATAAIRATSPEHRERSYFLQLEDGRVLFAGYWKAPTSEYKEGIDLPEEDGTFPSGKFEVARAPHSGLVLGFQGRGSFLEPEETFELGSRFYTERLLDVGDIVAAPWLKIRERYG